MRYHGCVLHGEREAFGSWIRKVGPGTVQQSVWQVHRHMHRIILRSQCSSLPDVNNARRGSLPTFRILADVQFHVVTPTEYLAQPEISLDNAILRQ